MALSRIIAAFRTRILAIDGVDDLVADRVYPAHLADVAQPVYPCVTLFHLRGRQGVWMPRIGDPAAMLVQAWSKVDEQEVLGLYDLISTGLHNQKTLTSTSDVCFHEVRELNSQGPTWIREDSVWLVSAWYHYRASGVT